MSMRVNVSEPVRLRPVTDPVSSERLAETVNMSERGLCVATDFPLKVGMQVELFLRIPREVSGDETDRRALRGAGGPRRFRAPSPAKWAWECASSGTSR